MHEQPLDDIDLLFTKLEPLEPPVDFAERVLQRARAESTMPRTQPRFLVALYAAVYAMALVGLAVLAYALGLTIARNGTSALVATLLSDVAVFADAPSAYLEAILVSIPWLHLLGVALDLSVLFVVTKLLLRPSNRERVGAGS
jgi:hypothetical protein